MTLNGAGAAYTGIIATLPSDNLPRQGPVSGRLIR